MCLFWEACYGSACLCFSRTAFWWMSSACRRFPPHKQGMEEKSRNSTGNTFICRVTFLLARPFDLSPLQYWRCVGLCFVTTTMRACGLVALLNLFFFFFNKRCFPFHPPVTLIVLVLLQYYLVINYFYLCLLRYIFSFVCCHCCFVWVLKCVDEPH